MGAEKLQMFIGHIKKAPAYLIDNKFILRGYRIGFNNKRKIFKSLFMLHNESVNVWSHLIGVAIFLGILLWTIISLSPLVNYFSNKEDSSYKDKLLLGQ